MTTTKGRVKYTYYITFQDDVVTTSEWIGIYVISPKHVEMYDTFFVVPEHSTQIIVMRNGKIHIKTYYFADMYAKKRFKIKQLDNVL